MPTQPRLLDRLRIELRSRHYSRRTEMAYVRWTRRFVHFHGRRHPEELDEEHVNQFLTHLATERRVSASTQGQALSALLFLYRRVLGRDLGDLRPLVRARRSQRLPVVLSAAEVEAVLARLQGDVWRRMASVVSLSIIAALAAYLVMTGLNPRSPAATLLLGSALAFLPIVRIAGVVAHAVERHRLLATPE